MTGETPRPVKGAGVSCLIPGCRKPHLARGMCNMHYLRHRRHGDPLTTAGAATGAPLTLVRAVIARSQDECEQWPYSANSYGYGQLRVDGRRVAATHLVLELTGRPRPAPPSNYALHSCDNPGCINPRHLRWGTQSENARDMVERGRQRGGFR